MTSPHPDTTPCDRCSRLVSWTIPAYWGEALCPDCCAVAASSYDLARCWPPLPDADGGG